MDVLSQAEHDTVAQAIFITPDEALLNAVELAIEND
jgi:histidinol dehydrogenase